MNCLISFLMGVVVGVALLWSLFPFIARAWWNGVRLLAIGTCADPDCDQIHTVYVDATKRTKRASIAVADLRLKRLVASAVANADPCDRVQLGKWGDK